MSGGRHVNDFDFHRQVEQVVRVLRCRKGFGLFESVRYGLWLARS